MSRVVRYVFSLMRGSLLPSLLSRQLAAESGSLWFLWLFMALHASYGSRGFALRFPFPCCTRSNTPWAEGLANY